jgi:chromosome segregation ATPase
VSVNAKNLLHVVKAYAEFYMVGKARVISPDERLEELQHRHQILEGERKTKLELSANQIKSNKETIKKLTDHNNQLRSDITKLTSSRVNGRDPTEEAIKLKAKLNALKSDNMRKEQFLDELKAQWKIMTGGAKENAEEKSVKERRMRVIENRIDKAMIKLNEAQSIKKTYEGILQRLKEERIGFDQQLRDLESQLTAKKKDSEELLLLSHDAAHAKEMAQAELHKFEQAVLEERNQRDREVMEKKLLVQQRLEMNQRMEKLAQEETLIAKQAAPPKAQTDKVPTPKQDVSDEMIKLEQKIFEYEDALGKLQEVTGVSDVNEIIEKFVAQQNAFDTLNKRSEEEQSKLDSLTLEYKRAKAQLEDVKYSSAGRRATSMENSEALVVETEHRLARARERFEKLTQLLIDINAGVSHLHARLADVKLDNRTDPVNVNEETIEEVLNLCEQKIVKLIESVGPLTEEELKQTPALPAPVEFQKPKIMELDDADYDISPNETVIARKQLKQSSEQFVTKMKKKQTTPNS